ncbi:MAG: type VI secretion system tip protein VgrG [Deltaproteobacteria bacterium]|nr:type VI secretion system tip protein VgrG [Deltaproteobacteria bacterium]
MGGFHLAGDGLPGDAVVRRFAADERLDEPFFVDVEFATEDAGFALEASLRSRACLTVTDDAGRARRYEGIVTGGRFVAHTGTELHFRLELEPELALLAHRAGCRIFQDQSTVDVVKAVLAEAGIDGRTEFRLAADYGVRPFVVQYRESDLAFLRRLLEDEGITFFFEHRDDGLFTVFADHADAFTGHSGLAPVTFGLTAGLGSTEPLDAFAREERLRPNHVHLRDFDHLSPQVKPEADAACDGPLPIEVFEYPAGLATGDGQGDRRAKVRLAELTSDAVVLLGESRALGLCPGHPCRVTGASEPGLDGDLVMISVKTIGEHGVEGTSATCANAFRAIPAGAPYAPRRVTPRPRIRGVQTAIVTGSSNEQQAIFTDEQGRVKVRFHWDRSGKGDDRSSTWVRVAQLGLGGSMVIPRVGWEVLVAFVDGDPDRPLVVGRVYNGKQVPLVDLPAAATAGAFKSLSTPGAAGSNELGTDDAKGKQGFTLAGAKDVNTYVGADKTESVGVKESLAVTGNLSSTVAGADTWTIGGSQTIQVGNALQNKAGGAIATKVGGPETVGALANYIEAIGSRDYAVASNRTTISNGVRTLVSGAMTRSVGGSQITLTLGALNDGMASSYVETVGGVKAELVRGDSAENVAGDKVLTIGAAEVHLVSALATEAASVSRVVGGVFFTRCAGNYEVSASEIAIVGGIGHFKGGGSTLKLNGGPIVAKGGTIKLESAIVRLTAGSLKLG